MSLLPPHIEAALFKFVNDIADEAVAMMMVMADHEDDVLFTDDEIAVAHAGVHMGVGLLFDRLFNAGAIDAGAVRDLVMRGSK